VFTEFDRLAEEHSLEKIKTIGDAYMVAGGIPTPRPDHCEAVVEMGLSMLGSATAQPHGVRLRIGIDTGPVVAGVIGRAKFIYDLWGDTVNTASRMESHGLPGTIQVTERVVQRLDGRYPFEPRGTIEVRARVRPARGS
jgi:class 3 adenylate cyclase